MPLGCKKNFFKKTMYCTEKKTKKYSLLIELLEFFSFFLSVTDCLFSRFFHVFVFVLGLSSTSFFMRFLFLFYFNSPHIKRRDIFFRYQ